MNISILGSKGSGKSTQVAKLKENLNILSFSPGEMFLKAARNATPLGTKVQKYIGSVQLIPGEMVNEVVHEWLWTTSPSHNLVFEGYPRTIAQASFLESALTDMGRRFDAVIYLNVSIPIVIERLAGRRVCRMCKGEFHVHSKPFDRCLYGRCRGEYLKPLDEDTPEKISAFVESFLESTFPLLSAYNRDRRLIEIDADQESELVHLDILTTLQNLKLE